MNPEGPVVVACLNVEIELRMKWSGSTIWITHRPLDDGFRSNVGRMLRIRWALRIRLSMLRCLSRAEVLTLFGGMWSIDGSRDREVGGLRVKYRHWGGLEGTPPSEDGMVGAWDESWGVEELGRSSWDVDGSVWPPLMRAIAKMGERRRSLLLLGGHVAWNGEEIASQGGGELFTIEEGLCEIKRGFGGL